MMAEADGRARRGAGVGGGDGRDGVSGRDGVKGVDGVKPVEVRSYGPADVPAMREIWNAVVAAGRAFPQEAPLSPAEAADFFAAQSRCGVAVDEAGAVLGLYILHPNNVGRCGHIANASYAVAAAARGRGVGEALVRASLAAAGSLGFRILQFNAVAVDNAPARRLYEKLGFTPLGVIPGGFRRPGGDYVDICLYWHAVGGARA